MLSSSWVAVAALVAASGTDSTKNSSRDSTRAEVARVEIATYGEVRTRSEWDKPMSAATSDMFTLMRTRLGARITPSRTMTVVVEGQDSRVLGDATAATKRTFDLYQGYMQLKHETGSKVLTVRAGRQEIAFANERLIGALGWTNSGRSFDGARLSVAPRHAGDGGVPKWSIDAFAAVLEERGRRFGVNRNDPHSDNAMGGVFATAQLDKRSGSRAEFTAIADVGSSYRAFKETHRYTGSARLVTANVRGIRLDFEGALQAGTQQAVTNDSEMHQSIGAWFTGVRVGNSGNSKAPLLLTVGADMLSGDTDASNKSYSAFNTLYGTNHPFYGLIDLFVDPAASTKERGLQDMFVHCDVRFNSKFRVHTELHHLRLATGSGRDLGWEADVVVPIAIDAQMRVDVGYSAFRAGQDAVSVGLASRGKVQHWGYVQLRAAFPG